MKSLMSGLPCGTQALKITWRGLADFFPEGEDAEGFLDTAQGDVEGVVVLGFVKDAFQAGFEEIQFIQEGGVMFMAGLIGGGSQGPLKMFGVAGERRDRYPVLGGQGTQGQAGLGSPVDFRKGRVSADRTAFIHGLQSSRFKVQS
jgi:hypothetical protein